jgi:hypothetical protein
VRSSERSWHRDYSLKQRDRDPELKRSQREHGRRRKPRLARGRPGVLTIGKPKDHANPANALERLTPTVASRIASVSPS